MIRTKESPAAQRVGPRCTSLLSADFSDLCSLEEVADNWLMDCAPLTHISFAGLKSLRKVEHYWLRRAPSAVVHGRCVEEALRATSVNSASPATFGATVEMPHDAIGATCAWISTSPTPCRKTAHLVFVCAFKRLVQQFEGDVGHLQLEILEMDHINTMVA